jgi:glycerol-1-phosphatase
MISDFKLDVTKMETSIPSELAHDSREVYGASTLLYELQFAHVPWAIVTSCTRALLFGWVEKLALPPPLQTVAAEDVRAGKPDPACYTLARERLEREAHAPLLVVEDSTTGVKAGKAAGCKVLGVATNVNGDALREAGADWVVINYAGLEIKTQAHQNEQEEKRWSLKGGRFV